MKQFVLHSLRVLRSWLNVSYVLFFVWAVYEDWIIGTFLIFIGTGIYFLMAKGFKRPQWIRPLLSWSPTVITGFLVLWSFGVEPFLELRKRAEYEGKFCSYTPLRLPVSEPASWVERVGERPSTAVQSLLSFYNSVFLFDSSQESERLVFMGKLLEKEASSEEGLRVASRFYERAASLRPYTIEPLLAQIELETERLDFDRASAALSKALQWSSDERLWSPLFKYHFVRRDYLQARDPLIRKDPTPERYYYYGLLTKIYSRGPKEQMSLFQKAYEADPSLELAYIESIRSQAMQYDSYYLATEIEKEMKLKPEKASLYHWAMGEAHAQSGHCNAAIPQLGLSISLGNKSVEVSRTLAGCLTTEKKTSEAIAEYERLLQEHPKNKEALVKIAEIQFDLKRYKEARETLERLLQDRPRYPGAFSLLAKIERGRGDRASALYALRTEVKNHPLNLQATLDLAEGLIENYRYYEALQKIESVENFPDLKYWNYEPLTFRIYSLKASAYKYLPERDKFLEALVKGLKLNPRSNELQNEFQQTIGNYWSNADVREPKAEAVPTRRKVKRPKDNIFFRAHLLYKKHGRK